MPRAVITFLLISLLYIGACPPRTEFHQLNQEVLLGKITPQKAGAAFKEMLNHLHVYCDNNASVLFHKNQWRFPLKGYHKNSVGGTNGNGYVTTGYNYFDGNQHKGHPAHDIFISDKNQDGLDDRTNKPVQVCSISGGLVIDTEGNWENGSELRGGKYVWIFDYSNNLLFYYAHNSKILVKPGTWVKPGDAIAEVGRTGMNAYAKRSPTHVHVMALSTATSNPVPYNFYPDLR